GRRGGPGPVPAPISDGIRIATTDSPFAAFVPGSGPIGPGVVISADQLMSALHAVQGSAAGVVGSPIDAGPLPPVDISQVLTALAQQFQQSKTTRDSKVSPMDMHTIDLVGMVFEYMLKDENLPDSIKALLSYMHT